MRISFSTFRRVMAGLLAMVYFLVNGPLAHAIETNVWKERKRVQLAALPVSLQDPALQRMATPATSAILNSHLQSKMSALSGRNKLELLKSLPYSFGTVRNITLPHDVPNPKFVIHIQDIHANQEAQSNISHTIAKLISNNKNVLLALEGAFSGIDLTALKTFPRQDFVKTVADFSLQKNEISGAIHGAVLSEAQQVSVVGIDDAGHYAANVEAFKSTRRLVPAVKASLAEKIALVEKNKPHVFNSKLLTFDRLITAYHQGRMEFGPYVKFLKQATPSFSFEVEKFMEAWGLESRLDFGRVEKERSALLGEMNQKLKENDMAHLASAAAAFRAGELSSGDFYALFKVLAQSNGINLQSYPALNTYFQYVLLSEQIRSENLFSELAVLERAAYASLANTVEEKKLVAESQLFNLAAKLVDFTLTKEEWENYKTVIARERSSRPRQSVSSEKTDRFTSFAMTPFEAFYREAELRDEKMAQNVLAAMDQSHTNVVVVVAGGFHASGLRDKLLKAGLGVVAFVPKVSKVDTEDSSGYLTAFTQEKTPLQKLFEGEKLFLAQSPLAPHQKSLQIPLRLSMMGEFGTGNRPPIEDQRAFEQAGGDPRFRVTTEDNGDAVRGEVNGFGTTVALLMPSVEMPSLTATVFRGPLAFWKNLPARLLFALAIPIQEAGHILAAKWFDFPVSWKLRNLWSKVEWDYELARPKNERRRRFDAPTMKLYYKTLRTTRLAGPLSNLVVGLVGVFAFGLLEFSSYSVWKGMAVWFVASNFGLVLSDFFMAKFLRRGDFWDAFRADTAWEPFHRVANVVSTMSPQVDWDGDFAFLKAPQDFSEPLVAIIRRATPDLQHRWWRFQTTPRQGAIDRKVMRKIVWSVADHTALLMIMVDRFAKEAGLSAEETEEAYRFALIHDIGELVTNDITPKNPDRWNHKHKIEEEAWEILGRELPDEHKRWQTYEKQDRPSARFVKQLDKVAGLIELMVYAHRDPLTWKKTLERGFGEGEGASFHQWADMRSHLKPHPSKRGELGAPVEFPLLAKLVDQLEQKAESMAATYRDSLGIMNEGRLHRSSNPPQFSHLPLYLWRPMKVKLGQALSKGELSSEVFDRVVGDEAGLARRIDGENQIEDAALPYLVDVLNEERGSSANPVTLSDVRAYLLDHENLHADLDTPEGRQILSELENHLQKYHPELLKVHFANNYGAAYINERFYEELLVAHATEKDHLNQPVRLLENPAFPRSLTDLPEEIAQFVEGARMALALRHYAKARNDNAGHQKKLIEVATIVQNKGLNTADAHVFDALAQLHDDDIVPPFSQAPAPYVDLGNEQMMRAYRAINAQLKRMNKELGRKEYGSLHLNQAKIVVARIVNEVVNRNQDLQAWVERFKKSNLIFGERFIDYIAVPFDAALLHELKSTGFEFDLKEYNETNEMVFRHQEQILPAIILRTYPQQDLKQIIASLPEQEVRRQNKDTPVEARVPSALSEEKFLNQIEIGLRVGSIEYALNQIGQNETDKTDIRAVAKLRLGDSRIRLYRPSRPWQSGPRFSLVERNIDLYKGFREKGGALKLRHRIGLVLARLLLFFKPVWAFVLGSERMVRILVSVVGSENLAEGVWFRSQGRALSTDLQRKVDKIMGPGAWRYLDHAREHSFHRNHSMMGMVMVPFDSGSIFIGVAALLMLWTFWPWQYTKRSKDAPGEIIKATTLDHKGRLFLGQGRPQVNGKMPKVPLPWGFFGHANRKKKVTVYFKDGVVSRVIADDGSFDESLMLVMDKKSNRPITSCTQSRMPDFDQLNERHFLRNAHLGNHAMLSIGNWDGLINLPALYANASVDITEILNPSGERAYVGTVATPMGVKRLALMYEMKKGSPLDSFKKGALFNTMTDRITEPKFTGEDGRRRKNFIISRFVVNGRYLKYRSKPVMHMTYFPGAEVEIAFVGGELRYVKLMKDREGRSIIDRTTGEPLVIDIRGDIHQQIKARWAGLDQHESKINSVRNNDKDNRAYENLSKEYKEAQTFFNRGRNVDAYKKAIAVKRKTISHLSKPKDIRVRWIQLNNEAVKLLAQCRQKLGRPTLSTPKRIDSNLASVPKKLGPARRSPRIKPIQERSTLWGAVPITRETTPPATLSPKEKGELILRMWRRIQVARELHKEQVSSQRLADSRLALAELDLSASQWNALTSELQSHVVFHRRLLRKDIKNMEKIVSPDVSMPKAQLSPLALGGALALLDGSMSYAWIGLFLVIILLVPWSKILPDQPVSNSDGTNNPKSLKELFANNQPLRPTFGVSLSTGDDRLHFPKGLNISEILSLWAKSQGYREERLVEALVAVERTKRNFVFQDDLTTDTLMTPHPVSPVRMNSDSKTLEVEIDHSFFKKWLGGDLPGDDIAYHVALQMGYVAFHKDYFSWRHARSKMIVSDQLQKYVGQKVMSYGVRDVLAHIAALQVCGRDVVQRNMKREIEEYLQFFKTRFDNKQIPDLMMVFSWLLSLMVIYDAFSGERLSDVDEKLRSSVSEFSRQIWEKMKLDADVKNELWSFYSEVFHSYVLKKSAVVFGPVENVEEVLAYRDVIRARYVVIKVLVELDKPDIFRTPDELASVIGVRLEEVYAALGVLKGIKDEDGKSVLEWRAHQNKVGLRRNQIGKPYIPDVLDQHLIPMLRIVRAFVHLAEIGRPIRLKSWAQIYGLSDKDILKMFYLHDPAKAKLYLLRRDGDFVVVTPEARRGREKIAELMRHGLIEYLRSGQEQTELNTQLSLVLENSRLSVENIMDWLGAVLRNKDVMSRNNLDQPQVKRDLDLEIASLDRKINEVIDELLHQKKSDFLQSILVGLRRKKAGAVHKKVYEDLFLAALQQLSPQSPLPKKATPTPDKDPVEIEQPTVDTIMQWAREAAEGLVDYAEIGDEELTQLLYESDLKVRDTVHDWKIKRNISDLNTLLSRINTVMEKLTEDSAYREKWQDYQVLVRVALGDAKNPPASLLYLYLRAKGHPESPKLKTIGMAWVALVELPLLWVGMNYLPFSISTALLGFIVMAHVYFQNRIPNKTRGSPIFYAFELSAIVGMYLLFATYLPSVYFLVPASLHLLFDYLTIYAYSGKKVQYLKFKASVLVLSVLNSRVWGFGSLAIEGGLLVAALALFPLYLCVVCIVSLSLLQNFYQRQQLIRYGPLEEDYKYRFSNEWSFHLLVFFLQLLNVHVFHMSMGWVLGVYMFHTLYGVYLYTVFFQRSKHFYENRPRYRPAGRLEEKIAGLIFSSFHTYYLKYEGITGRAKYRFLNREWAQDVQDGVSRINLHPEIMGKLKEDVRHVQPDENFIRQHWREIRTSYMRLVKEKSQVGNAYRRDLVHTYFYMAQRIFFPRDSIDDPMGLVWDNRANPSIVPGFVVKYEQGRSGQLRKLLAKIINKSPFSGHLAHAQDDALLGARALELGLQNHGKNIEDLSSLELLSPVFYQTKRAYQVGRVVFKSGEFLPMVLGYAHPESGVQLDVVLVGEKDVSPLFSYTRSNFHVDVSAYREMVEYLVQMLPNKNRIDFLAAIGFHNPAKEYLKASLRAKLARPNAHFDFAIGVKGNATDVFSVTGFPFVFKIPRELSKKIDFVGRERIIENYRYVHRIDRVGRMLDGLRFQNMRFKKTNFTPELLAYLQENSPSHVRGEGDDVVFDDIFVQKKVIPLNVYLERADDKHTRSALIGLGECIKELISVGIFPGDLMAKNFGVDSDGKVVYYDYDDVDSVSKFQFRNIPAARNDDEETMALTDRITAGDYDIFPEQIATFLLRPKDLEMFRLYHADLLRAEGWNKLKQSYESGEIPDLFPYPESKRLRHDVGSVVSKPGRLVLFRHGLAEHNARDSYAGTSDTALTAEGEAQVRKTAQRYRGVQFDAVFTSGLKRAKKSAEIFMDEIGQSAYVQASDSLNEKNQGVLEGKTRAELFATYGEATVRRWLRAYDVRPPQGQSLEDIAPHTWNYFQSNIMPRLLKGETVLVAAHGGSLRILEKEIEQLSGGALEKLEIANAETMEYQMKENGQLQRTVEKPFPLLPKTLGSILALVALAYLIYGVSGIYEGAHSVGYLAVANMGTFWLFTILLDTLSQWMAGHGWSKQQMHAVTWKAAPLMALSTFLMIWFMNTVVPAKMVFPGNVAVLTTAVSVWAFLLVVNAIVRLSLPKMEQKTIKAHLQSVWKTTWMTFLVVGSVLALMNAVGNGSLVWDWFVYSFRLFWPMLIVHFRSRGIYTPFVGKLRGSDAKRKAIMDEVFWLTRLPSVGRISLVYGVEKAFGIPFVSMDGFTTQFFSLFYYFRVNLGRTFYDNEKLRLNKIFLVAVPVILPFLFLVNLVRATRDSMYPRAAALRRLAAALVGSMAVIQKSKTPSRAEQIENLLATIPLDRQMESVDGRFGQLMDKFQNVDLSRSDVERALKNEARKHNPAGLTVRAALGLLQEMSRVLNPTHSWDEIADVKWDDKSMVLVFVNDGMLKNSSTFFSDVLKTENKVMSIVFAIENNEQKEKLEPLVTAHPRASLVNITRAISPTQDGSGKQINMFNAEGLIMSKLGEQGIQNVSRVRVYAPTGLFLNFPPDVQNSLWAKSQFLFLSEALRVMPMTLMNIDTMMKLAKQLAVQA